AARRQEAVGRPDDEGPDRRQRAARLRRRRDRRSAQEADRAWVGRRATHPRGIAYAWRMKTAALLASVLALGACGHHKTDRGFDRGTQKKLLIDRNWIDVMPKTERDKLHVYRFVPTMGGGVYQDRTIFKGTFE